MSCFKPFERLANTVLFDERGESLVKLVERLHARENEIRARETAAHGIRHRHLFESRIQVCDVYESHGVRRGDDID